MEQHNQRISQRNRLNPLICDSCVYVKYSKCDRLMLLCLYVDDTVVCFHVDDKQEWFTDKNKIIDKFAIKDLGECNWILNMKVIRNRDKKTISLSQQAYVEKMVKAFGFGPIRNNPPVPTTDDLSCPGVGEDDSKPNKPDVELYQSLVGSLLYAANITRVDVCYAVAQLCRFVADPRVYHSKAAYRVLKYLSWKSNYCLVFGRKRVDSELDIAAFTDADYAGDKSDRKSTSGTVVQFNGDTIK